MSAPTIRLLLTRDLRAVRRELEAYPDDASVWRAVPGLPNTAGTLALHVAGNIRHFIGGVVGRDGYVRDRDAEFARRDVPRSELIAGVEAAIAAVERALDAAPADVMEGTFPEPIAKRPVSAADFLVHLVAHLTYHLGQIDYHRRVVTGDTRGVDAVSVRELPERS
jgi:uncharacterized damage-inducible protein DinB